MMTKRKSIVIQIMWPIMRTSRSAFYTLTYTHTHALPHPQSPGTLLPLARSYSLFPRQLPWVTFRISTPASSSLQTAVALVTTHRQMSERKTQMFGCIWSWLDCDSQSRGVQSVAYSESVVSELIHRNINTLLGKGNHWAMLHTNGVIWFWALKKNNKMR